MEAIIVFLSVFAVLTVIQTGAFIRFSLKGSGGVPVFPEIAKRYGVRIFYMSKGTNTGVLGMSRIIVLDKYCTFDVVDHEHKEDYSKTVALIMHEIAHIKRKDNVKRSLFASISLSLVTALIVWIIGINLALWIIPTVYVLPVIIDVFKKRMIRAHEFAADQHALPLCKVNDSGPWSLCQGLTETRQRLSMNGYPSINDRIQRIVEWQVKEGEKEFNMMNHEKN